MILSGLREATLEIGEEVLIHERVKKEAVKHAVNFFDTYDIDFYLESNGGLFASKNFKKKIRFIIEKIIHENPEAREDIEKGIQPSQ